MKHFNQQLCFEGTFKTVVVNMKIWTHKYIVPKYLSSLAILFRNLRTRFL